MRPLKACVFLALIGIGVSLARSNAQSASNGPRTSGGVDVLSGAYEAYRNAGFAVTDSTLDVVLVHTKGHDTHGALYRLLGGHDTSIQIDLTEIFLLRFGLPETGEAAIPKSAVLVYKRNGGFYGDPHCIWVPRTQRFYVIGTEGSILTTPYKVVSVNLGENSAVPFPTSEFELGKGLLTTRMDVQSAAIERDGGVEFLDLSTGKMLRRATLPTEIRSVDSGLRALSSDGRYFLVESLAGSRTTSHKVFTYSVEKDTWDDQVLSEPPDQTMRLDLVDERIWIVKRFLPVGADLTRSAASRKYRVIDVMKGSRFEMPDGLSAISPVELDVTRTTLVMGFGFTLNDGFGESNGVLWNWGTNKVSKVGFRISIPITNLVKSIAAPRQAP